MKKIILVVLIYLSISLISSISFAYEDDVKESYNTNNFFISGSNVDLKTL